MEEPAAEAELVPRGRSEIKCELCQLLGPEPPGPQRCHQLLLPRLAEREAIHAEVVHVGRLSCWRSMLSGSAGTWRSICAGPGKTHHGRRPESSSSDRIEERRPWIAGRVR